MGQFFKHPHQATWDAWGTAETAVGSASDAIRHDLGLPPAPLSRTLPPTASTRLASHWALGNLGPVAPNEAGADQSQESRCCSAKEGSAEGFSVSGCGHRDRTGTELPHNPGERLLRLACNLAVHRD